MVAPKALRAAKSQHGSSSDSIVALSPPATPGAVSDVMTTVAVDEMKLELDRMRARLLDLSARNTLLNYTHPRGKSLRMVDEVPAIVLERLVAPGATGFQFAPLASGELTAASITKPSRW